MEEAIPSPLDFLELARATDPHPAYHALRRRAPVHWSDQLRGWVLTRYDDSVALLRDPRFSADRLTPFLREVPETIRGRLGTFARSLAHWVLVIDGPHHTRIRGLMNQAFTPRAAEALAGPIRGLVDSLLDGIIPRGRADAIADLAYPLPALVIGDLLGVPREERANFQAWSDDIAGFIGSFALDPDVIGRAARGLDQLESLFRHLIDERRRRPGDDLISRMLSASDRGAPLSDDELFANCAFLLFAGHETTTHLIGNGLYWWLRNPDQVNLLREHPRLVPQAVEEFLRYEPSIDRISRIAREDATLRDTKIRKGDRVIALTGAANRDPDQFGDPDRLDITRTENRHLAFGLGAHFCFGAPLARVEARIVFERMLERVPEISLERTEVSWRPTLGFRGLERLPIVFE